jgi:MYXO-CTERM domain-containing protein
VDLYVAVDQGVFTAPANIAFNADGSVPGTIAQPGTANGVITVGAYVSRFKYDSATAGTQTKAEGVGTLAGNPRMGNLAVFSSRGPTRDGRLKPDITAPGAWIASRTATGVADPATDVITVGGNSFVLKRGTSFASPHVAGIVALMFQKNNGLTPQKIRELLETSAIKDSQTDNFGAVPNVQWGVGKVNTSGFLALIFTQQTREAKVRKCSISSAGEGPGRRGLMALSLAALALLALALARRNA